MYTLENISKSYKSKNIGQMTSISALQDIYLKIDSYGIIYIVGAQKSGKTTLLNILYGSNACTEGSITYYDTELSDFTQSQLLEYRKNIISYIDSNCNLIDYLSVQENIDIALDVSLSNNTTSVSTCLSHLELDNYEKVKVKYLSPGEKLRLALAREILRDTEIILLDEPDLSLDKNSKDIIMRNLIRISKDKLIIITSQDINFALQHANRIITLNNGEITSDKFNRPSSEHVAYTVKKSFSSTISKTELTNTIKQYKNNKIGLEIEFKHNIKEDVTKDSDFDIDKFKEDNPLPKSDLQYYSKIAKQNIRLSKSKLTILVMLFSLCLVMLSTLYNISSYNAAEDYTKLTSELDYLAYDIAHYEDNLDNPSKVSNDLEFYNYLIDNNFDEKDIAFKYSNKLLSSSSNKTTINTPVYAVHDDYDFSNLKYIGNEAKIVNDTDIIISLAIAHDLFGTSYEPIDYVGLTFTSDEYSEPFTVVGIIDVDYSSSFEMKKLVYGNLSNISVTNEDIYKYLGIYTNMNLYREYSKSFNAVHSRVEKDSTETIVDIYSFDSLSDYSLFYGEYIQNTSEVMVSKSYLYSFCDISTSYSVSSIDSEDTDVKACLDSLIGTEIGTFKDSFVNSYLPDTLTIVGVVDLMYETHVEPLCEETCVNYFISVEDFSVFRERSLYSPLSYSLLNDSNIDSNIETMLSSSLYIKYYSTDNYITASLSAAHETSLWMHNNIFIIMLVLIIMFIPAAFIYTYIKQSITAQNKEIYSYKIQGYTDKQIMIIYVFQSIYLAVITLIVASLLTLGILQLMSFIVFYNTYSYDISAYKFSIENILIIVLLITTIITISLSTTYFKLSKKPPVNVIEEL